MEIFGNIVDVIHQTIFPGKIVVMEGVITDVIPMPDLVVDRYILPGFVDAHVHIESSMLVPSAFARVAVQHGTVATVSDPHEIANVMGTAGIAFMIENGRKCGFKFNWTLPSCVPATGFETAGANIDSQETLRLFQTFDFVALSEMMNFPGVLHDDKEVLAKIAMAQTHDVPVDGHAPGLSGAHLKRYVAAGISTDHEASNLMEAKEKIELGMNILIREGSSAKNFENLFSLINDYPELVMLCCDDIHPEDLLKGHINTLVARAVAKGMNLFKVLRAATLNPIKHYRLKVGLLQKGDCADFILVRDLKSFAVEETWINGSPVFQHGAVHFPDIRVEPINNFIRQTISADMITVFPKPGKLKIIHVIEGSLLTEAWTFDLPEWNEQYLKDHDFLKVVVVNRYKQTTPSVGFVHGFGLKRGALASSVAHDSHNLIAVGVSDTIICNAITGLLENKGGIIACDSESQTILQLEVAGLMSIENAEFVAQKYEKLNGIAKNNFECTLTAPFMTLSFLSLLVIPELKIGDKGLFNVSEFKFSELFS